MRLLELALHPWHDGVPESAAEPVGDRFVNLHIALIGLVDHLDGWAGPDTWLGAERTLGATFSREVMEADRPGDGVEQRLGNLRPLMSWAHALSHNLRRFRSAGHDQKSLQTLEANALDLVKEIHASHGWELTPTTNPQMEPLKQASGLRNGATMACHGRRLVLPPALPNRDTMSVAVDWQTEAMPRIILTAGNDLV